MARGPAYARIRADFGTLIAGGQYRPGEHLPTESALAEKYGVTRMTIRKAIDGLVADGLVMRRQGSGTYVLAQPEPRRPLNRLAGFSEDMHTQGHVAKTQALSQESIPAPRRVKARPHLDDRAWVIPLDRLPMLDGKSVAVHRVWLPLTLCPPLAREPLPRASLYEVLESDYGVRLAWAQQQVTAVVADSWHADLLEVSPGAPLLLTKRLPYDDNNVPIELAEAWSKPAFRCGIELKR